MLNNVNNRSDIFVDNCSLVEGRVPYLVVILGGLGYNIWVHVFIESFLSYILDTLY